MTKDNPGCIHQMYAYLRELSGIHSVVTKKMTYKEVFRANAKGNRVCRYPTKDISFVIKGENVGYLHKAWRKGNVPVLTDGKRDFPYDVEIDHFLVNVPLKLEEFGIPFQKVGKYKDSLGGGWYSKVDLYQVNDKFFANMDCTC